MLSAQKSNVKVYAHSPIRRSCFFIRFCLRLVSMCIMYVLGLMLHVICNIVIFSKLCSKAWCSMLPAGCTLRSGLWSQMMGCVSVSLSLSQNVITTLVRNPSLRDSFVVAGLLFCLSGCVVRCCLSFAKIIHDRPKAMEKRDWGALMDVKLQKEAICRGKQSVYKTVSKCLSVSKAMLDILCCIPKYYILHITCNV